MRGWRGLVVVCLTATVLTVPALAEVSELPADQVGNYSSVNVVTIAGDPQLVWENLTGDVSGWWDHSWSESPLKMYIEPSPGGGFYEIFDEEGHGVLHATVIAAIPGKLLRLDGPLGLAGRAIDVVTTYELKADGDSTVVTVTCNMSGNVDAELAKIVDGVHYHFIGEQLKNYIERQESGAEGRLE